MKKLYFVIPTFNRKECVRNILTDIQNQQVEDVSISTILVIDGSNDGTKEMVEKDFPAVLTVNGNGSWWYTKSMNQGFDLAYKKKADLVLTMNDDVRLKPDYVKSIFQAWKKEERDSVMGSISVSIDKPHKITFSGVKAINWWRYKQVNYITPFKSVDPAELSGSKPSAVLPGRGILIPMKILKELDYFDGQLVQYGSDDDFCLRARKKGYKVNVSYDAVVYSHVELTGAGNPVNGGSIWSLFKSFNNRYSSRHLKKTAKMIARHGSALLLPLTLAIVILGSLKAHLKFKG
ncbi:MAG: glycosyltransferase family 2 protein [Bacteroidota bacterium]